MTNKPVKSVVLFSGGLDSTTILALAISKKEEVYPLTIFYGQRHSIEIKKAKQILEKYNLTDRAVEFELNLSLFNKTSLINQNMKIRDEMSKEIPSTYVPSRNLIFSAIASGYAETVGASKIYIGVNSLDYSGYPDCRPEFIESLNKTIAVGTKKGVESGLKIETPLLYLTKKEIIELGISLNVDYSLTHSCYNPSPEGLSCGKCDSCRLRLEGFRQAGIKDPLKYV